MNLVTIEIDWNAIFQPLKEYFASDEWAAACETMRKAEEDLQQAAKLAGEEIARQFAEQHK